MEVALALMRTLWRQFCQQVVALAVRSKPWTMSSYVVAKLLLPQSHGHSQWDSDGVTPNTNSCQVGILDTSCHCPMSFFSLLTSLY